MPPISRNAEGVSGFCRDEFLTIPLETTVANAIQAVRQAGSPGRIFYLYVVDTEDRLHGIVSIRNLLLSRDDQRISEICSKGVVFLPDSASIPDAYRLFSQSRFLSLPVLDSERKIRGVIHAHELIGEYQKETHQLFEERTRGELFELLGIKAEDASHGLLHVTMGRLPWLLLNVLGGALSALFIHLLGGRLTNAVAYLMFLPILLIIAESIGMQTASIVITNLHRAPSGRSAGTARRELLVALALGAGFGISIGAAVLAWKGTGALALTIGLTILLGSLYVSILGIVLPYLVHRLRGDPRIAAGPVVMALADCGTLLLYLLIALAVGR